VNDASASVRRHSVSEGTYPPEKERTPCRSLAILENKDSVGQGSHRAAADLVMEKKLGKTMQRKLRAEIDAEVEMAVKDGKDSIITLPTNEYGEVKAYSTQW
jgi:hypothetical protein